MIPESRNAGFWKRTHAQTKRWTFDTRSHVWVGSKPHHERIATGTQSGEAQWKRTLQGLASEMPTVRAISSQRQCTFGLCGTRSGNESRSPRERQSFLSKSPVISDRRSHFDTRDVEIVDQSTVTVGEYLSNRFASLDPTAPRGGHPASGERDHRGSALCCSQSLFG